MTAGTFILVVFWIIGAPPNHQWVADEVTAPSAAAACAHYDRLVAERGVPWAHVVMVLDTPGSASRGATGVTCGRRA